MEYRKLAVEKKDAPSVCFRCSIIWKFKYNELLNQSKSVPCCTSHGSESHPKTKAQIRQTKSRKLNAALRTSVLICKYTTVPIQENGACQ
jgi:hypothetical protein